MASFYAELQLEGHTYRVWHCSYSTQQATDARGRVSAKVRHGPLHLLVDVPASEDATLLAWAAAAHKPLAGRVVFFDIIAQVPHETIAFAAGECVRYFEQFASGSTGQGAYRAELTITAPVFELKAGGPAAPLAVAAALQGLSQAEQAPTPGLRSTPLAGIADLLLGSGTEQKGAGVSLNKVSPLLEIARAVNPLNGQTNCTHIVEAVVDRLHGTNPAATAPDLEPRTLRELVTKYNTSFEPCADFQKAFDIVRERGEGATAMVAILPTKGSLGHIVTVTNHDNTPTIIEGQNWGPYHPVEVITSAARAERRYGADPDVRLVIAIIATPPAPPDLASTG